MAVLAQESGAEARAVLFGIGYLALLIYLIVRFVQVANDVREIKNMMRGGASSTSAGQARTNLSGTLDMSRLREAAELHQSGILNEEEFARIKASLLGGWPTGASGAIHTPGAATRNSSAVVHLLGGGPSPEAVVRVLMDRAGYLSSGAKGAVTRPPQIVLRTPDTGRAAELVKAIEAAGGAAEIREEWT